jgi:hypothetical protein
MPVVEPTEYVAQQDSVLFGHTVNMASRMESTGLPGRVQVRQMRLLRSADPGSIVGRCTYVLPVVEPTKYICPVWGHSRYCKQDRKHWAAREGAGKEAACCVLCW